MYEGWQRDAARAAANWSVTNQFQDGKAGRHAEMAAEFTDPWLTRHVVAQAGTGSRYSVVVARLGLGATVEGGSVLVSVLSPWQAAYPMSLGGYLTMDYVAEKLTGGRWADRRLHGGDLAALTMTICHALGRPHDVALVSVAADRTEA